MWIKLESDEFEIIDGMLDNAGLHGLRFLIKSQYVPWSPKDVKKSSGNAVKAAETYFSADDLEIDDYVRWDDQGNAQVMCWQKVPPEFIIDEDCNCGDKKKPH